MSRKILSVSIVGLLGLVSAAVAADLPPNAQPGECYARVAVPAVYNTETERVQTRDASERIEIAPARFEWTEEIVLLEDVIQNGQVVLAAGTKFTSSEFADAVRRVASSGSGMTGSDSGRTGSGSGMTGSGRLMTERLEAVPATYGWASEKVMVTPPSSKMAEVPAEYTWTTEQVVVKPAQTVWKKGRGPVERVDNGTGEIMCLVEEPAVTKSVRRKVLKTPARTKSVEIPAEYKTIKKQVLQTPATTRTIKVPVAYDTVKVKKLTSPASERRIDIPAEYDTVTKQVLVTESRVEWQSILCQTNMGGTTVTNIQRALQRAGHNPGAIDGVIGSQTLSALRAFQRAKGLPTGAITIDTLNALNVRIGG